MYVWFTHPLSLLRMAPLRSIVEKDNWIYFSDFHWQALSWAHTIRILRNRHFFKVECWALRERLWKDFTMPALEIYRAPRFFAPSLPSQHSAYSNTFPGSGFFPQPVPCSLHLPYPWYWASGSPSVVQGPAVSVSPGNLLGMQILRLCPRPTKSDTLRMAPNNPPVFIGPPGGFDAGSNLTASVSGKRHFSSPSQPPGWPTPHKDTTALDPALCLKPQWKWQRARSGSSIPGMHGTQFWGWFRERNF